MSAFEKTLYRANARELSRALSTESTKKKKRSKKENKFTTAIGSLKEEKNRTKPHKFV